MRIRLRKAITAVALVAVAAATTAGAPKQSAALKPADLPALVAAMTDPDPEVAARAVTALGDADLPAAHDALLDALAFGMPGVVATVAITQLARHPAPADVVAIVRYTHHHDPGVRTGAIAVLAGYSGLGDPAARQAVIVALHDGSPGVRAAAATAAARAHLRGSVEPLFVLLAKGEEPAAHALAQLADPELAAKIADQLGHVPDALLALCLGQILIRADFGPDPARVEVVRALSKISDRSAALALGDYVDKTPKNPPRASRAAAEKVLADRGSK